MAFGFSIFFLGRPTFLACWNVFSHYLEMRVSFITDKDIHGTECNIMRNYRNLMIFTYHLGLMLDNRFKFVAVVLEKWIY